MRDGTSVPNSKTPDRLSARTKNRTASAVTTAGDWSWKPQPSCSPTPRSPAIAAPSAQNAITTPAANAMASRRSDRWSPSRAVTSPSAFSDSTGKTQGIRFSNNPPANPKASATGNERPAPARVDSPARSPLYVPCTGFGPAVATPTTGTSSAKALQRRRRSQARVPRRARRAARRTPLQTRATRATGRCECHPPRACRSAGTTLDAALVLRKEAQASRIRRVRRRRQLQRDRRSGSRRRLPAIRPAARGQRRARRRHRVVPSRRRRLRRRRAIRA